MTLTPSQCVFGVVLPGIIAGLGVLAGLGGVSGWASEEGGRGGNQPSDKGAGLAQLAMAYTKAVPFTDIHPLGVSPATTGAGSQAFFVGRTNPANTPLEMLLGDGDRPLLNNGLCPPDMASIDDLYCVDRYEASLLEVLPNGQERPFSPYESLKGHTVRAVSESNVFPRGYISAVQAEEACGRSGKRLCKPAEWRNACMGPKRLTYGYSATNEPGRCNDHGRSPMEVVYSGANLAARTRWDWDRMNAPGLNQVEGTLARSGSHSGCTNDYGVYDMVGNLHEWVADPNGTFQGGYYLDTRINGEGCTYTTTAHAARYHDYSTGFRCCADVAQ
jgi:sulfatase modifying factor 1